MHKQSDEGKKPSRSMLKDVKIGEVSFVGRGANSGARQSLFKTDDPIPTLVKRLFNEVVTDANASKAAQELLHGMMEGTRYLKHSFIEIMEDPRIEQRKDMLRQTVQEFSAAMANMIDEAPLTKTDSPDAIKKEAAKGFLEQLDATETEEKVYEALTNAWDISAALRQSFESILKDDSIKDKQTEMKKQLNPLVKAYTDLIEGIDPTFKKEDETMSKEALEKLQKKFDDQQEVLTKTQFIAGLNDAEKVHYNGLDDAGKEAFAKMDADARATAVQEAIDKKAADEETFEMDGNVVKKSEVGPGVFAIMKAQQVRLTNAETVAKEEREKRIKKEFEDEAQTLIPHLPGTAEEKGIMLKGIRDLPKEQQDAQIKILKSSDEAMAKSMKEEGQGGGADEGNSATEKLNKLAREKADKENTTFEKAYTAVLDTKEGSDLYAKSLEK